MVLRPPGRAPDGQTGFEKIGGPLMATNRRGPKPDPLSLRTATRQQRGTLPVSLSDGLQVLPRERSGAAPKWPLAKPLARELVVWRREWKRPQAIVWERHQLEMQVAMYVRTLVECESVGVTTSRRSLMLAQERSLLLTHETLARAGYRIASGEAPVVVSPSTPTGRPASSRGRLRAVPDQRERLRPPAGTVPIPEDS